MSTRGEMPALQHQYHLHLGQDIEHPGLWLLCHIVQGHCDSCIQTVTMHSVFGAMFQQRRQCHTEAAVQAQRKGRCCG